MRWDDFLDELEKSRYRVGDYVELERGEKGRVRYVGAVMGEKRPKDGIRYGVELEEVGTGQNDGYYMGLKYFESERNSAVFVREKCILEKLREKDLRHTSHLRKEARPLIGKKQMKEWFGGRRDRDRDDREGRSSKRNYSPGSKSEDVDPLRDAMRRHPKIDYCYEALMQAENKDISRYFRAVRDYRKGRVEKADVMDAWRDLIQAFLNLRREDEDDFLDYDLRKKLRSTDLKELQHVLDEEMERIEKRNKAAGRIGTGAGDTKMDRAFQDFKRIGKDGTGFISAERFREFLEEKRFRASDSEIQTAYSTMNPTGRKQGISRRDFLKVFNPKANIDDVVRDLFKGRLPKRKLPTKHGGTTTGGNIYGGASGGSGYSRNKRNACDMPWKFNIFKEHYVLAEPSTDAIKKPTSAFKGWNRKKNLEVAVSREERLQELYKSQWEDVKTPQEKMISQEMRIKLQGNWNSDYGVVPEERILVRRPRNDPLWNYLRKHGLEELYSKLRRSNNRAIEEYFKQIYLVLTKPDKVKVIEWEKDFRQLVSNLLAMSYEDRETFCRVDMRGLGRAKIKSFWNGFGAMGNLPAPDKNSNSIVTKVVDNMYKIFDQRDLEVTRKGNLTEYGAQQVMARYRRLERADDVDVGDPAVKFITGMCVDNNDLEYYMKNLSITRLKQMFEVKASAERNSRNKKVNFDGFCNELQKIGNHRTTSELRKMFNHIDRNRRGTIRMADFFDVVSEDDLDYGMRKALQKIDAENFKNRNAQQMHNWNSIEVASWILEQGLPKSLATFVKEKRIMGKQFANLDEAKIEKLELTENSSTIDKLLDLLEALRGKGLKGKKRLKTVTIKQSYANDIYDVARVARAWYGAPNSHWDGEDGKDVTYDVKDLLRDSTLRLYCKNLDDKIDPPRYCRAREKVLVVEYEPIQDDPTSPRRGKSRSSASPRRGSNVDSPRFSRRNSKQREQSPRGRGSRDYKSDRRSTRRGSRSPARRSSPRRSSNRSRSPGRNSKRKSDRRSRSPDRNRSPGRRRSPRQRETKETKDSPLYWDREQVGYWLEDIGLPSLKKEFKRDRIDGKELKRLSSRYLEDLRVRQSDIDFIFKKIKKLSW